MTRKRLTGSVQIKNGFYYIALNTYMGGKRKPTWIPTKIPVKTEREEKKAQKMLNHLLLEYEKNPECLPISRQNNVYPIGGRGCGCKPIQFVDHLSRWLTGKKRDIDIVTWESYETYVNIHLIPYFRPHQLYVNEVTPRHIKEYYNYKASNGRMDGKAGGLSTVSIRKHASILKMVFDEAMILEGLATNPVVGVPITKGQDKETKIVLLTADDANSLLDAATEHELKALIYVALYYGLRRSELVGLKWSAIDFDKNIMEINFTVVRSRSVVEKKKTKTRSSKAKFVLLNDVKQVLLELRERQKKYACTNGEAYNNSDFVFVRPDGERYSPDSVTRMFVRLLQKNNIPHMRLHDLRHSCASVLYDKGWDMKAIQTWMRHSDSSMTSYYTHLSESKKIIMAADMDSTFRYKAQRELDYSTPKS